MLGVAPRANADVIYTVGAGGTYATVTAAVDAADADPNNYTVIEVAPGTYTNQFSVVTTAMTIEVNPNDFGQVLLLATVPPTNLKGIITTDASLTVNGLTFEGAAVNAADGSNGAGIRDQPGTTTLNVENSNFTMERRTPRSVARRARPAMRSTWQMAASAPSPATRSPRSGYGEPDHYRLWRGGPYLCGQQSLAVG
jgi:hypothetical protein